VQTDEYSVRIMGCRAIYPCTFLSIEHFPP
jgi:hypothetical protein